MLVTPYIVYSAYLWRNSWLKYVVIASTVLIAVTEI